MTLGLAETGNAWHFAHDLWALPSFVGEVLQALAVVSFIVFILMYINQWVFHRAIARAETDDPVQSAFLALIPESVILIGLALEPYVIDAATTVFWMGSITNLLYGALRLAANWTTRRTAEQIVAPLYLPYTASILVNSLAAGVFGYIDYGWMLLSSALNFKTPRPRTRWRGSFKVT